MTLYEYNILELNEQLTIVWNEGELIDNHFSIKERRNLYPVDMFFVEVINDVMHNTIIEVQRFKTGHLQDKYSDLK
jgi:hypothetical protein